IDRISSEAEIKQLQNELILALNSGWRYIGKRDARFIVKAQDQPPVMAKNMHTNGECVEHKAIVLPQTDALLFDGKKRAGQLDIDLFDVYAKYWADITEKSCKLSDFFARQKMVGGYLSRRYAAGDTYYPYILTEAGSVFVLEIEEAYKAKTILTEIRKYGLPLPDEILGTLKDKNASWAQCPFVPENGFGEIQINLNWHWQKKIHQQKNRGGN
ncbi:MAG: hypothetical protein ACE5I1_31640, partial [bacterium]